MNAKLRHIPMLASLVGAALLTGCADDAADPEQVVDPGRTVAIDGLVYECDDTVQTADACEEYVYEEGADASEAQSQGTLNDDGTVTIDGRTYACEDQSDAVQGTTGDGACEEYRLQSEA